jgi:hypothetical protein
MLGQIAAFTVAATLVTISPGPDWRSSRGARSPTAGGGRR